MQRTIVLEYQGKKIVSQPFTFKHACIMDDERHKAKGKEDAEITDSTLNQWAFLALQKMFEGTELTDEVLDGAINIKELRKACSKILDWFFGVDEEVKNS